MNESLRVVRNLYQWMRTIVVRPLAPPEYIISSRSSPAIRLIFVLPLLFVPYRGYLPCCIQTRVHTRALKVREICIDTFDKLQNPPDDEWKRIESFDASTAAMAIIPLDWPKFIGKLKRKDNSNIERLLADCQVILVQGFLDCWKRRCAKFHALHRPEPDPV